MTKKRRKRHRRGCPCGSGRPYPACCRPVHRGDRSPDTAKRLMQSRFAAYAIGAVDYIVDTTDPQGSAYKKDVDAWRQGIEHFCESTDFLGLEVVDATEDGDRATVTFRAKLAQDGHDASFAEKSEFRRRDGTWLYVSGERLEDQ